MNRGAVIVLVPDGDYKTLATDPHMSLAYFGSAADLLPWQVEIMENVTRSIAMLLRNKPYWNKRPKTNGRVIFHVDPEFNDGNRFCYADAVDHNGIPRLRGVVEDRLSFSLERGHGLTPHMTIGYSDFFSPDLAKPTPMQVFDWKSVELWMGDDRRKFPIQVDGD